MHSRENSRGERQTSSSGTPKRYSKGAERWNTVHFSIIMDLCHSKNAESAKHLQKYRGRVVLLGTSSMTKKDAEQHSQTNVLQHHGRQVQTFLENSFFQSCLVWLEWQVTQSWRTFRSKRPSQFVNIARRMSRDMNTDSTATNTQKLKILRFLLSGVFAVTHQLASHG